MSPPDETLTSLPEAYVVLAKLQDLLDAQGYRAPLSQRLDVLHDFVSTEWNAMSARFDGKVPRRYATTAFGRFARRRVIEERRLQALLVPDAAIGELAGANPDPIEALTAAEVRGWLAQLAPETRQLLVDRYVHDHSERELAMSHRITRHELRQRLAGAVAAFAAVAEIGADRDAFSVRVARALFVDGLPIPAAAVSLGVTEQRIRAGRDSFLGSLGKG